MKKLVTISREYGSGGRIIGKLLAQKLGVPFYDKDELIELAAEQSGYAKELLAGAELKAKNSTMTVMKKFVHSPSWPATDF